MSILYGQATRPYGWEVEHEHLNRIHREDLQNFYRRYYFPKNIMLSVYGDFSVPAMKDLLEKTFADWKADQPPVPKFPEVTAKPAPGIYLGRQAGRDADLFRHRSLGWRSARSRFRGVWEWRPISWAMDSAAV